MYRKKDLKNKKIKALLVEGIACCLILNSMALVVSENAVSNSEMETNVSGDVSIPYTIYYLTLTIKKYILW